MNENNIDIETVADFGCEWSRFSQSQLSPDEYAKLYGMYFDICPKEFFGTSAVGADFGCGSGRWAMGVAKKVELLYCVDASAQAIEVAKKNLSHFDNINFLNEGIDNNTIRDSSLDFAYSLGVLHHMPNTLDGIKACVSKIKPNGFFLIYLYYNMDNKPYFYRLIWIGSNFARKVISRLPFWLKSKVCDLIAVLIYWPLAKLALLLDKIGFRVSNMPLSFYRNSSFYTMRTDALDRFGTKLEQRFSKKQIRTMMENAGLKEIVFSDKEPFWVAIGRKCAV